MHLAYWSHLIPLVSSSTRGASYPSQHWIPSFDRRGYLAMINPYRWFGKNSRYGLDNQMGDMDDPHSYDFYGVGLPR